MVRVVAPPDRGRMQKVRVLLVDDGAEFLASASDFLSRDPRVEVVGQALHGREGVRLAEALAPDIVFMDLIMPVMNGLEAARRIKSGLTPPRVIIVTLYDDQAYRRSAEIAGADGFIAKANFAELALAMIDAHFAATECPANSS
jgi:DNA-binding NarL/FixJ family response regulator